MFWKASVVVCHTAFPCSPKVRERVPGLSRFAFNITRFIANLLNLYLVIRVIGFIHRHHLVWAFGFRQLGMAEQRKAQPAQFGPQCEK
jgi:hypothetical protein